MKNLRAAAIMGAVLALGPTTAQAASTYCLVSGSFSACASATFTVVGSQLHVEVTNLSGTTLNNDSGAFVYAMLYDDSSTGSSQRVVRAVQWTAIPSLGDGETETFSIPMAVPSGAWASLPAVVFVEYQPAGASGPWDMLQAVAVESL